jgi:hypothetical protein
MVQLVEHRLATHIIVLHWKDEHGMMKAVLLAVALALGAVPALAHKEPPRSCELYWTAAHACAYGHSAIHCNQRRREHLRRECLREGGHP